ncbi:M48 family metallopeptidase [Thalassotalea sp. Y01]|uniref:M48 family metallopeptidase n=1 Tax=Thalassotalea sp. Y01 TaxID=2729613 RepID=UPI00145DF13C|nr:M48 family metallopeptidase [Thalassotalea sp. Y01]NMP17073.1 M48 family metalloprotease [Thalassotalea sp. Y01]
MKYSLIPLSILLVSCASTVKLKEIQPLDEGYQYAAIDEEDKLFKRSERLYKDFKNKGLILKDESSQQFVDDLASKISPPTYHPNVKIRFHILKDASTNAFALPNGDIYLNTGLIASFDNSDQLAAVMAHEVAHVIQRHSLKGAVQRKNKIVGSHIADLMLFGTGLVYYATIADISKFSRNMEHQADVDGLAYLKDGGFDLRGGVQAFEKIKELDFAKESTSIWSTHPDIDKRIAFYNNSIANEYGDFPPESDVDQPYLQFRKPILLQTIKIRLRNKQFELAERLVNSELELDPNNGQLHYYAGEINRLKASEPEAYAREYAWIHDETFDDELTASLADQQEQFFQKAKQGYLKAQSVAPDMNDVNKGLGMVAFHQGETQTAIDFFTRYLQQDKVKDRRYVESILAKLRG